MSDESKQDGERAGGAIAGPQQWELLPVLLPPLLCGLFMFAPCCAYSEWYIDELFAVLRNEDARGESSWSQLFTNDFWGNPLRPGPGSWTHKSYRPLCVLSFAWQFWLLGGDLFRPQPLRAFNVALHAANSALLAALLRFGLRLSRRWSSLAACLFALHPVHVENVVYLVGRADMLAASGWMVASLVHLRLRRALSSRNVGVVSAALLLGLCTLLATVSGLCKESGLTLLVFNAGIELCTAQVYQRSSIRLALAFLAGFVVLTICRFRITQGAVAVFGFVDTPVQYSEDFWVRVWSYLYQHAFYARLLLLPGQLSWDYSFDALPLLKSTWHDVRVLGVCSAYLGLIALSAWSLCSAGGRRVLLGLQSVIVPFVPASNLFFTVGVTVGERLLYPSTVGAAIVIASIGQGAEYRAPGIQTAAKTRCGCHAQARPLACGGVLLLVYASKCSVRVWQWHSSEALYEADARNWPGSLKSRHQLATVYHRQDRYAEALEQYNASLGILDDNALTDHCIAQVFIETGRYQDALDRFDKIQRGHGVGFSAYNLWMFYVDYGFALVAVRRFEQGIPILEQGLERNLAVPHGLNAVGYAYASLQMLQEAQDWLAKGIEYDPDNAIIWNNLAVVWMLAGAYPNAAQGLEKALLLEPENPHVVHNVLLLKRAAETGGGSLDAQPRLELFFSRTT